MTTRTFLPGDEWLYYKIYCGVKMADDVLINVILPLTEEAKEKHMCTRWFFIRYADSDTHLRVRFKINEPHHAIYIMQSLNNRLHKYIQSHKVWSVMLDTYNRELERYYPNLIHTAESLFHLDSISIAKAIKLLQSEEEDLRWKFSFRYIDSFLDDFKMNKEQKFSFTTALKELFGKEFGMGKFLKLQLDKKYRYLLNEIKDSIQYSPESNTSTYNSLNDIIHSRSNKHFKYSKIVIDSFKTQSELNNYLANYTHMMINRLFPAQQRLHEFIIYEFLTRYYKSEIARMKYCN